MEEVLLQRFIGYEAMTIALFATLILPRAVWNPQTGQYRGYFTQSAILVLALLSLIFGFISVLREEPGPEILINIGFHLFLGIVGSRLMVEYAHKKMFGVWLHKQYHRLNDSSLNAKKIR